jgi:hypothetical protein
MPFAAENVVQQFRNRPGNWSLRHREMTRELS